MKKQLLLFAMILLPLVASADAVEVGGIYYILITKTKEASITKNPNHYTGSINIPPSIKYGEIEYNVISIESNAFESSSITSISIPNSVTNIGEYAFHWCSSLTSISIPNSITIIEDFTFSGCSNLVSVVIPNSVTMIGACAFAACSSLASLDIPNSVSSIDRYAFNGCKSLTSINIPNSTSIIGSSAFINCIGLTSITIGNNVSFIGSEAFASCPEIKDFYCNSEKVPSTNSDAFKKSYIEYATLHVPSASIDSYKAADPWKNFKSIVAIDGETPTTQKCEKPTISYENGQLKFASATDGVEFISEITDSDIKKNYEATVSLTATYNISVYATKSGYDNSDVATATLCWIDASPKTEGITNGVAQIAARPVLVKTDNGFITVEGADDRTNISVYTTDGMQVGSAISQNNIATIATSIQPGSIAIVKVGDKAVKVVIK